MEPMTLLPFSFEVKANDSEARTFSGLASTWDEDLGRDIVHRGAFARTLEHWSRNKAKNPVPLMDWHGFAGWGTIRSVLGKMTDATEVETGLDATFQVTKGNDGDEALHRIRDGIVTGLSIGYRPVRWEIEEDIQKGTRTRHLYEVELREISLLPFPMNDDARVDVASVKALIARLPDADAEELRALLSGAPDIVPPAPTGLAPDAKEVLDMVGRLDRIRRKSLGRV